jgi:hypothetical protein
LPREQALAEIAFCEAILAKGGLSVLSETLQGASSIAAWEHFPAEDVYDPASNSQWFYHCHPATDGSAEHGHFHLFLHPDGRQGPIHHLLAIGVDAYGRLLRLFTVNQWVVGDDWADAETTIALLSRFDMQMPQPSYLVNRWLTGIVVAYEEQIIQLLLERDRLLETHVSPEGLSVREDRSLEVLSEFLVSQGG